MYDGLDRHQWIHTSHGMWAKFAAAGAEGVTPADFDPYRMTAVNKAITLEKGDVIELAKGLGLPIVYG